jgi:hypothetical protein
MAATASAPNPAPEDAALLQKLKALSQLSFGGLVQMQYVRNDLSRSGVDLTGKPANKNEFEVRRARLRTIYAMGPAELLLTIDAIPAGVTVKTAEASIRIVWSQSMYTKISAGLMYIPWGYETQEANSILPFMERSSLANRLFPGQHDIGVRLSGGLLHDALVYQVALMNGNPSADAVFPLLDPNGSKDLLARIGLTIGAVRFGISGLLGTGYLPATSDDATTNTVDESHAGANFAHRAAGIDITFQENLPGVGTLALYAEGAIAHNLDRGSIADYPRPPTRTTDGTTVYGVGLVNQNQVAGYLGILQHLGPSVAIGARGELFDRGTKTGRTLGALTLVSHVYPYNAVRLSAAYQCNFEFPSIQNNVFWLRAQVWF